MGASMPLTWPGLTNIAEQLMGCEAPVAAVGPSMPLTWPGLTNIAEQPMGCEAQVAGVGPRDI